ncbi:hypothetical protein MIND_01304400 [Mycena indigotica]|uniref:Polyketide cyclase/dehydrase n=1 Tax=Mycena indigotica TaxID=2126181 RepID=A0A8H6VSS9_9AGAR|nr:uncharacterized protein MIND_01304400 [Mycena indigotica]KAF7290641.1 hypothetical protein MIND_01304400 [Mycena indigotica]
MSTPAASFALPVASEWPTYISRSVVIDAPREKVWSVFTDFKAYPEWNPYWRECTLLDEHKRPLGAGTPVAAGHRLSLKLHIPPTMDDTVGTHDMVEALSHVEAGAHLVWTVSWGFLLRSVRLHHFADVEGEAGAGRKTEVVVVSAIGGLAGRMMPKGMLADLTMSIEAMNAALKKRCEAM